MPIQLPTSTAQALQPWLSLPTTSASASLLASNPLVSFSSNLDTLPPHLVVLLGSALSIEERGSVPRIRGRRMRYLGSLDEEEWMEDARRREPLLWKQLAPAASSAAAAARKRKLSTSDILPSKKKQEEEEERKADSVISPEEVEDQPQFKRLMRGIAREEMQETLERQKAKEDEVMGEVETDSEEEEEEEEGDEEEEEDAFEEEMKRRFIWGDMTLPAEGYACDFEERWDVDASSSSAARSVNQRAVPRAIDDEDRWFDEEEAS